MNLLWKMRPWVALAIFLGVALAARCWNREQIFHEGKIDFVDADCYSRMTRVQRFLVEPWKPIRVHDFENAPFGTEPHTTAPMDLTIAALARIFDFRFSIFASLSSLDLGGAFVSPLLGLLLVAFLWWWGRFLRLPYRNALLLLVAVSPVLAHGFLLGRPDHQSLILLLTGVALASELALWTRPEPAWKFVSAVAWALALWTSLFEPVILLTAAMACRVFVLGRPSWPIRHPAALITFVVILGGGLLFDGWRTPPTSPEIAEFFPRWSRTIGELNHLKPQQLVTWTGWLLPVLPVLLILRFVREKHRPSLALAFLVVLTAGLSLWYARWGYFLALTFALSLPYALSSVPGKPLVWIIFLVSLWPLAAEWDHQLFPDAGRQAAVSENIEDAKLLREVAEWLASQPSGVVLAPWWLSPAIAYRSGQQCVAGSSHQSLPGIADTARFYLAADSAEAREILEKRGVRYVVAYEPSRVLTNSSQILGSAPPRASFGKTLYENPYALPGWLQLIYENKYFKVYRTGFAVDHMPMIDS